MKRPIVLDTNVILSGLRSRNGASFEILQEIYRDNLKISISVPLIFEYESVLQKFRKELRLSNREIEELVDYLCSIGKKVKIYYLWRPFLKDPFDDHVLELAVNSGSRYIVTFNKKDFVGISQFGIRAVTPRQYLDQEVEK